MSLIDKVSSTADHVAGDVGHFAEVFGKAAWRSGAIEPWNGVAQLVDEGTNLVGLGKPLPQVQLDNPAGSNEKETAADWTARTIGSGFGMVLPFLAADSVVGKTLDGTSGPLASLAAHGGLAADIAPYIRPVVSGAAYGLVFTPSSDGGNFLVQRGINAVTAGITFGAQRAATVGLMKGLALGGVPVAPEAFGNALSGGMATAGLKFGANMFGGTVAGAANAETNSLLHGNGLASKDQLGQSVLSFAVTGGALELAHMGSSYMGRNTASAQGVEVSAASRSASAHAELPSTGAEDLAENGSGKTMDVQSRITDGVEGPTKNSELVLGNKAILADTLNAKVSAAFGNGSDADLQRQQFSTLLDSVAVREHDGVGMDGRQLAQTFSQVNRLLNTDNLVVKLTPQEKLGLAHQLLTEAAKPYQIHFRQNTSAEAAGVQSLLSDRVPGKITAATVDLLATGKYTSNKDAAAQIDLSPAVLSKLPPAYRNTLAPDLEARRSLSDSVDGQESPNLTRSYASQLKQLLVNNMSSQLDPQAKVFVQGPADPHLPTDSGERMFTRQADGTFKLYESEGTPQITSRLKTADLQPIFDHVSGINNDSAVLKNGNYFLVMNTDGSIGSGQSGSRFGLYGSDTRFLNQWDVKLNGQVPQIESGTVEKGYAGNFQYTNREAENLPANSVKLSRDIVINNDVATERLKLANQTDAPQTVHLTVGVGSDFADMFEVRGWQRNERGTINQPIVSPDNGRIILSYQGLDGATMSTDISAHGQGTPTEVSKDGVHFTVTLPPNAEHSVELSIKPGMDAADQPTEKAPYDEQLAQADKGYEEWRKGGAVIHTESEDFNKVIERAYRDLYMLKISSENGDGIAAGIPWYVARFGRDQEITSLQTLLMQPGTTRGVLTDMAAHQGKEFNAEKAEKPGKMMHELRTGEMARNKEIPFTPYYGTVDATPLWLSLLGKYVEQTGDLELAKQLQPNVDAALQYLDGETQRNGYLSYGGTLKDALSNQGWKDSGDSIMHEDGTLLKGPISLSEPQGYLYQAWRQAARLAELQGDQTKAQELTGKADALKDRFTKDFWMPDKNYVALALDGEGRQANVITSNPGHLLSTGILLPEQAQAVVNRLMQPDMYSGFGFRTLSSQEARYNPGSYHNGTVWPHDVSMIAAGIHDLTPASGISETVLNGMFDAAKKYPDFRLPELFGGFTRRAYPEPIPYPETSSPQAWAAGSMFQLMSSTLGLHANGLNNSLLVFKPSIPDNLGSVTIKGLRVGQNSLDLRFDKKNGHTTTKVLANTGNVDVNIQS